MEGGTLDFNDLMDTGDEFPGFEITKFTPVNGNDNDDDVLKTPEHEQEDDFVPAVGKAGQEDKLTEEAEEALLNGDCSPGIEEDVDNKLQGPDVDIEAKVAENWKENGPVDADLEKESHERNGGEVIENDNDASMLDLDENGEKNIKEMENNDDDIDCVINGGENNEKDGEKTDGNGAQALDIQCENMVEGDEEMGESRNSREGSSDLTEKHDVQEVHEPPVKKKKLYLQPPRPKMKLWGSSSNVDQDNDSKHSVNNRDDSSQSSVEGNCSKKDTAPNSKIGHQGVEASSDGDNEHLDEDGEQKDADGEQEEDGPHQQSFLSFLNLKPGSSKPRKEQDKNQDKKKEEEFYSRKRLRTRKKVSYVDAEAEDDDDEYEAEDSEEEEGDHMIDLTSPRKGRVRNNSRSPGHLTTTLTPKQVPGAANYALALQTLLPGVDLTCLKTNNQTPKIPTKAGNQLPGMQKIAPRQGPLSFQQAAINQANKLDLKGLFECGICGKFFATAGLFIAHQDSVHAAEKRSGKSAIETFRCEVCNFVLTNRYAYLEHKKMKHNKSLTFTCSKCRMPFSVLAELQKHQMACGRPSCNTCHAQFKSWVEVGEHRIKVHGAADNNQVAICKYKNCNFMASTQQQLATHVKTLHMNSELIKCTSPKCPRVFQTRDQLNEHKKEAHASEFIVQYQCIECKNCFSTKTILAEHQYLHSMEKLRKCDLCSRRFTSFNDLRRHREVHVAKGTFRCQACKRWCTDKAELCFEEMDKEKVEAHSKAHGYYVKLEEWVDDGKNEKKMFLYPNL
ncbi:ZO71-like protein, partial [Mya arenaria]